MMKPILTILMIVFVSVPVTTEAAAFRRARSQRTADVRININTAAIDDLTRLPGVGPTLAERIVEHRRKNGPFRRPPELIAVKGMNARLYRQIAPLIRI
jgi:competence protein ComEA